ncbi:hypothetical protein JXD20_00845 [Candidatus Peregrinibacteria bacterium]|nr:hypothetical protein [Candidatus Peregrinibacteria bacterium]
MGVIKAINTARETGQEIANKIPNTAEARNRIVNACNSAIQTCKGSTSVMQELRNARDAVIDLPVGIASNTLKACTELVTGHPVNAVCDAAKILTDSCKNAGRIIVSPVAMSATAIRKTANTAAEGVRTSFRAVDTVKNGVLSVTDEILGGTPSATAGAAAPSAAKPPPQPPATAA